MTRVITLLSIFTLSWQALSQTVIVGQPIRALEAASSVVTEPPTNTLYFWFQADAKPLSDGAVMGSGGNTITNSSLKSSKGLIVFANGTQPPYYSNNVLNSKSAIFWTNAPTSLTDSDPGPTTITGWTMVIVFKVPTPNTTYFSTVPVWSFSNNDRGLYYNILSSGNGLPQYWLYVGSTQALITSSNDWQIVSTRFEYASGVPEIRDNASTVIGATATIANETVRVPVLSGVGAFSEAGPDGFAELLFYTNRLSDDDLILARRYLTNKYAIVATP